MKKLFFLSFLLLQAAGAFAGALDGKMDSIAKQFARDAAAKGLASGTAAAVFPYSCDERLARKRVDLAVSELLTGRLQRDGSFRLVERSQLEAVMKEQALGLSGALDSASAAQVGKLAGARLAVLGTVARVGNSYQISSKLVDTASAEIISVSIVEVPLETFDSEAARYLVLVPEKEALGLYLGFSWWPVKAKQLPPVVGDNNPLPAGATITPKRTSTTFHTIVVGLRYQVARKWLVDLAVAPMANLGTATKYDLTGPIVGASDPPAGTMDGMGGRLSINRTSDLSRRWRAVYGVGYQAYGISYFSEGTGEVPIGNSGKSIYPPSGQANIFSAYARGGLEFKVKNRFNWSIFGQLNQPRTVECKMRVNSGPSTIGEVKIMELDMPVFNAETALTFYF